MSAQQEEPTDPEEPVDLEEPVEPEEPVATDTVEQASTTVFKRVGTPLPSWFRVSPRPSPVVPLTRPKQPAPRQFQNRKKNQTASTSNSDEANTPIEPASSSTDATSTPNIPSAPTSTSTSEELWLSRHHEFTVSNRNRKQIDHQFVVSGGNGGRPSSHHQLPVSYRNTSDGTFRVYFA